ncbi:hypothetical protein JMJ35_005381 [Cladonia borealis]|uniref:Azaphilone pigments biosynthesis cluster protein L N-terminal domain-containing protein n=1 Tax=Cladonia borealis TaxID=184061 RepID=A0AA39QZU7_9LECA|nr:hypothetical protein JMJ35_005381 [Cladonia borealis]
MDGLSGAASVITVVGLAVSSTQTIYNIVSGIKNGPNAIQSIKSSLQDLLKLLQQLKGSTDQLYLAVDLEGSVSKCVQDLKASEDQLAKLCPRVDSKAVRLWNHVKAALQEKDLERMSAMIQRHVASLSLQLQIIEGGRGSSHTMSLDKIEALSRTHLIQSTKNTSTLERTDTVMNQVSDSIQALGTIAKESHQSTLLSLEQLSDKVQYLPGLSTGQFESLNATCNAIFELLKQQLPAKPLHSAAKASQHGTIPPGAINRSQEEETQGEAQINSGEDHGLQNALDRLCHFAKQKEKTAFSEEAEIVIRNLQHILKLLLLAEEEERREGRKGMTYEETSERDITRNDVLYQDEVKQIKRMLGASHCVSINEKVFRSSNPATARYKVTTTHYQRHLRNGTVTIQRRCKSRRLGDSSHDYSQDTPADFPETLEASFSFLPKNLQNPHIAVKILQTNSYEGSFLKKPALSVSALLPLDAEPFRLIEEGDLNGLKRLLGLRQAFLTDRDLEGRSLLSYAMHFAQLDICNFLVDKGAVVDFLEPVLPFCDMNVSSLEFRPSEDYQSDPEEVAIINRCRLLLIQAGADPTLDESIGGGFIKLMLEVGTTETIRLILDHGLHFVELDSGLRPDTWLQELLIHHKWSLESIALLLRRQGKGGLPIQLLNGCLHKAISGSNYADLDEMKAALILLIRGGADVYARDNRGRSVSDIACSKETRFFYALKPWQYIYNHDLPLRKIWTEALNACGYDAEEVISTATRMEELSDDDDESTSAQNENYDSAESDGSEGYTDSPTCPMDEGWGAESRHENNDVVVSTDPLHPHNQYERSLLEGDMEVWGS